MVVTVEDSEFDFCPQLGCDTWPATIPKLIPEGDAGLHYDFPHQ